MNKTLLTLVFTAFSLALSAQSYLYLEKKGEVPDYRWKQGDGISVLLLNGEELNWREGYFNGGDSAGIVIGTRYYTYDQIKGVRYENGLLPFFGTAAMYGAALFTGVFAINGIINNDRPVIRQEQLFVGAGLLAIGLISKQFWYTERLMEDEYRLKLINTQALDQ